MLNRLHRAEIANLRSEAREALATYRTHVDAVCQYLGITTRREDYPLRELAEKYCDGLIDINTLVRRVRVAQERGGPLRVIRSSEVET